MVRLNTFVFMIFCCTCVVAQEPLTLLRGRVIDRNTGSSIPMALVIHGTQAVQCKLDGYFEIPKDPKDSTIRIKMVGYHALELPVHSIQGQDIFMEESTYLLSTAIVSASKREQPIAEATVSTSVIRKELPDRLNTLSGEKVLDRIPGVQIIDGQANIRGGSGYSYGAGSRVLLLMDEMPMMQMDAANPYWNDLPIENIGQIEVIKGAASTLYGSAAMNGVIHFRSETPGMDPYTEIILGSGIYLQPKNNNQWWGKPGTVDFPSETYLSLVHRRQIGKNDYALVGSLSRKIDYNRDSDSDNYRVFGNFRRRLTDSLLVSFAFNVNGGSSQDFFYWKDAGAFEGAPGATTSNDKFRLMIDPSLRYHDRKGFHHKLLTRYYYIHNGADNQQGNRSHHAYGEYQLRKNIESLKLDAQLGAVWSATWTSAQLYSDTSFTLSNKAFYAQLERKWGSRLTMNGGIRYEAYTSKGPGLLNGAEIAPKQNDDRLIYRAGLNYRLFEFTYLRTSVGEGFRFPSIAEKYISTTAGGLRIVPNPNLQSEHGWSIEIGVRQGWSIAGWKGMFDLSIFQSRYFDMMEFVLNNQLQFQSKNIGNTEIKGFELESGFQKQIGNWTLGFGGGITLIDPRYREFDLQGKSLAINEREFAPIGQQNAANSSAFENVLKYRSKNLVRADFNVRYKKLFFGYSFQYASHVEAIDWLFQVTLFIQGINQFRAEHDHGYRLHDLRVGTQWKAWTLQLNLNNSLNETYTIRPGLMEAPRNLYLKLSYKI